MLTIGKKSVECSYMKYRITVFSTEADCNVLNETGNSFMESAGKIISRYASDYGGDASPELFEGLMELAYERENTFTHNDFSTPEDNFIMTLTVSY